MTFFGKCTRLMLIAGLFFIGASVLDPAKAVVCGAGTILAYPCGPGATKGAKCEPRCVVEQQPASSVPSFSFGVGLGLGGSQQSGPNKVKQFDEDGKIGTGRR